jgi:RimJ/RimL family protein N-acetyltransferase
MTQNPPSVPALQALIPGTDLPLIELLPMQACDARTVSGWLADPRARCWLDLDSGRQEMDERSLFLMLTGRRCHARLTRAPGSAQPFGLVCLNDCANEMGSAGIWGVRGHYGPSLPNAAVAAFLLQLANGFLELEREVIGSWVVEGNQFSVAMHERLGLRLTGRQRARHRMNGRLHDRLLFDITRSEFAQRYPDVPSETGRTFATLAQPHPGADA